MPSSKNALKNVLVLHGPNLNLLGKREPEIYGADSLAAINKYIQAQTAEYSVDLTFYQTNHEGQLIDKIHAAPGAFDGIVCNPAAWTHYSIALRDAIAAVAMPAVEVHLSDISQREAFRRHSVIRDVCIDQISGFGKDGYVYGVEALIGDRVAKDLTAKAKTLQANDEILKWAVELLSAAFPKYDWTGIYMVEGYELVVRNYIGAPTPHERIPIGQGICGAAVSEQDTIIVPDVNADPRYLACSIETKSEIVVPIYCGRKIIGEIDIDSHRPDVFKPHDQRYLENVAEIIGRELKR
ncbi:MAG: type II 3-dehydroquinate dehydratase [bacterium]